MDRAQAVVASVAEAQCSFAAYRCARSDGRSLTLRRLNESASGRAEIRRVEVMVLVNKGVAGGSIENYFCGEAVTAQIRSARRV